MVAANCSHPWRDTYAAPPGEAVAGSVMLAFTTFTREVCLRPDDLQGLNSLYPTCEQRVLTPHDKARVHLPTARE